jgi:hypothetical protein
MYGSISKRISFDFDDLKKMYGEDVVHYKDIGDLFVRYLKGETKKYPFSEGSLQLETNVILDKLVKIN